MRIERTGWIAVATLTGLAACDQVEFPIPQPERFEAALAGSSQVPPVTTTATGAVILAVSLDTFLAYRINVTTIDTPTVAHIHEGAAGVGGGATLVTLYSGPTRSQTAYSGPLGQDQLRPTSTQLAALPASYGATPRERFDALVSRMRAGTVYVDVHTQRNPTGEVRGQVQRR